MNNTLNSESLTLLSQLEGSVFFFYSGADLGNFQTATSVSIATSSGNVAISGDVLIDNFQGYPNEYSKFVVKNADPDELAETIARGNTYLFHRGETINRIEVIEETLEELVAGNNTWVYRTDVSVVFKFETGSIAISKMHHNHEVLLVQHTEKLELDAPELENFFEEDLLTRYKISQRTLSLEEAKNRSL